MRARAEVLRDVGAAMSPMDAWLLLLGLETLAAAHGPRTSSNAATSRRSCKARAEVAWVREAGSCGSVFTFGLRGGREAGRRFIDALELWSHLANVGDAKSLVIHPASTTHSQLTDDELRAAGVEPEMVRLSVGLEDVDDLTLGSRGNAAARARCARMILTTPSQRRELLDRARTRRDGRRVGQSAAPELFGLLVPAHGSRSLDVTPINPTLAAIDGVEGLSVARGVRRRTRTHPTSSTSFGGPAS